MNKVRTAWNEYMAENPDITQREKTLMLTLSALAFIGGVATVAAILALIVWVL